LLLGKPNFFFGSVSDVGTVCPAFVSFISSSI